MVNSIVVVDVVLFRLPLEKDAIVDNHVAVVDEEQEVSLYLFYFID